MKKKIVLIGGGGHCGACIDVIEKEGKFGIAAIVDVRHKIGRDVLDYKIAKCDDDLPDLVKEYKYVLITMGQIKSPVNRMTKFEYLKKLGARFPVIVSPASCVSKYAALGEGTIIMHKSFVNSGARVGENCIINTGAIIEHDTVIGSHCHVSTGSIINGECRVGPRSFIGSGSVLANNISVGSDVLIGAGSVVVRDVLKKGVYAGNPAERISE